MAFKGSNTINIGCVSERADYTVNGATTKPGHLVERASTGKIAPHSKAGGHAQRMFALEDDKTAVGTGTNGGRTRSSTFADLDLATVILPCSGQLVLARLQSGQNVGIGQRLISGGDGTLKAEAHTDSGGEPADVIAFAEEAVDASGAEDFIPVRIR